VNGRPARDGSERLAEFRRTCVYLPQNVDNTFHDDFTVRQEMSAFRRVRMSRTCDERAEDMANLERLGLGDVMGRRVRDLSGGERRRVAIARALAQAPKVMLFDEPTAGLDTVSEHDVMVRLRELAKVDGKTVICTTHALSRVGDFDRVLLMRPGGRLVFSGTPAEAIAKAGLKDAEDPWEALYKTLEESDDGDRTWSSPCEGPALDRSEAQMPEPGTKPPSFAGMAWGYFASFARSFLLRRLASLVPFAVLGVLALVLWAACGEGYIFGESQETFKSDCYVFAFCGCLAMFWTGLLNSVGSLVGERVPRRCLERLDGVSMSAYLLSKFAWHALVCTVQACLFALCLAYLVRWGLETEGLLCGADLWAAIAPPLLVCSLSGMAIGMTVSAAFTSETRAVEFIPVFAIAQLLLSRVVVDVETSASGAAAMLTNVMPCRWPIDWMSKLLWMDEMEVAGLEEQWWSLRMLANYLVVCIALSLVLQRWNERKWQGR